MKTTFPGHYRPTEEEFSEMWDACFFAFDANVLVDLCLKPESKKSKELFKILEAVSDRIWLPHHAALEYQRVRLDKLTRRQDRYDAAHGDISRALKTLDGDDRRWSEVPDIESIRPVLAQIHAALTKALEQLEAASPERRDLLDHSEAGKRIAELFAGRVGRPYPSTRLDEIYVEGQVRYDRNVPPGYGRDEDKADIKRYGDLVIWYQLIDKGKEACKPLIFISDDQKPDWFRKHREGKGKTIGPRQELANEMAAKAQVQFYLYTATWFMEEARKYLQLDVAEEALEQARKEDEEREKARQARERAATSFWGTVAAQPIAGPSLLDFRVAAGIDMGREALKKILADRDLTLDQALDSERRFQRVIDEEMRRYKALQSVYLRSLARAEDMWGHRNLQSGYPPSPAQADVEEDDQEDSESDEDDTAQSAESDADDEG